MPLRPEDFRPDAPGKLVRSLQGYWTFEPSGLPPPEGALGLNFALARALEDARGAIGELAGVGRMLPNPHLLIRPFIQREAVSSSRIEGTITRLDQLFLFEAEPDQIAHPDDVEEVRNYVLACEHGLERVRAGSQVSLRLIREIHQVLMTGVRGGDKRPGEFRKCDVRIGRHGDSWDQSRFVPAAPTALRPLLRDFERFLNHPSGRPVVVDLALMHYQFGAIHPFMDGNGRVGRLLFTLLLCERGLLPQPLLYLSDYLERHDEEYRDHLLAVSQRGTWGDWIRFLARGITEQARDAATRAGRLLDLWRDYQRQVGSLTRAGAAVRLVDLLFTHPFITIPAAARYLEQTYPAAQNNVEKLVKAGILRERAGKSSPKVFVADAILRLLDEPLTP
jgi:Fic family protein